MEVPAVATIPVFTFSRIVKFNTKPYFSRRLPQHPLPQCRSMSAGPSRPFGSNIDHRRYRELMLFSYVGNVLRNAPSLAQESGGLARLSSLSFSTAASGGGGGGESGRGLGGGGGGSGSGEGRVLSLAVEAEEGSSAGPDVILLDVGGMSCGGCAASVKRILESQPQVSSAAVNLATETAVVWAVPEGEVKHNWQKQLGMKLASQLTTCGFKSNIRDSARESWYKVFERKMDEKLQLLKQSGQDLAVSWALCAVCFLGHASHFLGSNAPSWVHAFHSTPFHLSLSLFTFAGPGRRLILDGLKSLCKGSPNMNTLVGLGALSSFAVSAVASLMPKLGWRTFFEEPIMLIAFVLLGKNLEQRAKIKATSDMTGLLNILPTMARLIVDSGLGESSYTTEVPCSSLAVGDQIVVFPGDRIPADGIVKTGRSTVDESSFTGEPMPVTKLPGNEVTAGSINLNGRLTIEVKRPGGETVMGDIVRLVEEAQAKEAPIQRLADKVAGHFTYGVMAVSAATFIFWSLFGSQLMPTVIQRSPISLALQLSCSVLVIACPCALGLATPTAVLVGTSLGATRGLLLRGGNVLEKFAQADTVVFDKTGTLTIGKPVVTEVVVPYDGQHPYSKDTSHYMWSEIEVLRLASGVESNTNHPLGKAIVDAARVANCDNVKATDGTFKEEPGSGAIAIVEQKTVTVGTLSWLRRHGVDSYSFPDIELNNHSVVYVGVDGSLAGLIYFEDKIREDARQVVEMLRKEGLDVYMLSGDKRKAAEHVASIVGIDKDKVFSEVKPDQKSNFIEELQKDGKVVAMVGDGINDAAALALSDIGIAMGEGVGAASDVSSIVLMGNRLSQLSEALELSKQTMKTVRQNLWWAFAYNIVGIPVAAGLLLPITGTMLTPSIAGALMGFSSLGVMSNSLLLRLRFALKHKKTSTVRKYTNQESISDVFLDISESTEKPSVPKWRST
ncbi:copper-transporting ATPase PAA1, chloroplastic isoform X1 [Dendrobium catenatum]|uniref:copper-transporting ATPase PAA1, chloroplastic isoform X1 n=1 Tax=Dendrobium catenatum TaxID=906689 RepID=UPI0009F3EA36|nr:copper-transporting ATPase PAA1, chloroplastic isoform X1 [Dendrobium catenatum]